MTPSPGRPEHNTAAAATLAESWANAVIGTSYVSMNRDELLSHLHTASERLIAALASEPFDVGVAREVGASLVDAHFTDSATLRDSVAVLGLLPSVLGADADDPRHERLRWLQGALAEGYADALRDRTFEEQDRIRRAAMAAKAVAENALRTSEARFRAVFAGAPIGIGVGAVDGEILDVNQSLVKMLDYSVEEFRERNVGEFMHPEDAASVWRTYDELVRGERDTFRVEKRFFRKDGDVIWTDLAVSLVRDEQGRPQYQVAMIEDITERQRLQSRLEYQATHDPLTGLPNRALFRDRLDTTLSRTDGDTRVGLCFIDLDGFKLVNDRLGHNAGDELLSAVAHRLDTVTHDAGHLLARMGGDEFVVLCEDATGTEDLTALAERLLTTLSQPFHVAEHELTVSASIGIVERAATGAVATDLLRSADLTLQWAKSNGKGRWAVYDRHRDGATPSNVTLSATMPMGLRRREFTIDYQPIVALATGGLFGAEALVRWRHPQLGLLAPGQFIPIAEETGLIVPLGGWVLREACRQAGAWRQQTGRTPVISVNVAARQLSESDIVAEIEQVVSDTGLKPQDLQLELTESALMVADGRPHDTLLALADLGVGIVIDDFGTGYSSLSYLRSLPATGIKLAASFIAGMHGTGPDASTDDHIVVALVRLARRLGIMVTAEGVETRGQADRLRDIGCDAAQGRFFGVAGPPDDLLRVTNDLD